MDKFDELNNKFDELVELKDGFNELGELMSLIS